jgi:hypothetical protein
VPSNRHRDETFGNYRSARIGDVFVVAGRASRLSPHIGEKTMQMPAFRLLAFIGVPFITLALSACHGDSDSPAPTPTAKAACGGAAVANADMHCPPGFVQPKS